MRTIRLYAFLLRRLLELHHLDLETCNRDELVKVLDRVRSERSPRYYILHAIVVWMALQWLKRKDLTESMEFPKRPDPVGAIKVISEEEIQ